MYIELKYVSIIYFNTIMPEISEVRLTAQFVTAANTNRTIQDVTYLKTNKLKLVEEIERRDGKWNRQGKMRAGKHHDALMID